MRFSRADKEPSTADQIGLVEQRLHVTSALAEAMSRPQQLLEAVTASSDPDEARGRLTELFGFDEVQTSAVLDAQFRMATSSYVGRLRDQQAELAEELVRLENRLRSET